VGHRAIISSRRHAITSPSSHYLAYHFIAYRFTGYHFVVSASRHLLRPSSHPLVAPSGHWVNTMALSNDHVLRVGGFDPDPKACHPALAPLCATLTSFLISSHFIPHPSSHLNHLRGAQADKSGTLHERAVRMYAEHMKVRTQLKRFQTVSNGFEQLSNRFQTTPRHATRRSRTTISVS
jgi:hypothetical protein